MIILQVSENVINLLIGAYHDIRLEANPYDIFNSDVYLHDWGLCVDPAFRGMNVEYNILASLEKLSMAVGIRGALIMFMGTESQLLATSLGYKVYNELVYEDYKDENGEPIFSIAENKSSKFMGIAFGK